MNLASGAPVAVGGLSHALAELWDDPAGGSDELPLCRALTANLIVVAACDEAERAHHAVEVVARSHPCRAFVLLLDAAADELAAELRADVRQSGRGRQTVVEEVTLRIGPRDHRRAAGVVRPLLVQDVPAHLFWAAPLPRGDEALLSLARLADQTVLDSCALDDPVADFERLAAMPRIRAVDLATLRMRPWRRALAEAFEHFAWRRDVPTRVEVQHGPACGAGAAARGLARWLRRRLGAEVELVADPRWVRPGQEPGRLELWHGDAHVVVEHRVASPQLVVWVTRGALCLLPWETPAVAPDDGELIALAIDAY